MTLYFHATLSRLNLTYHQFFEISYQWKFNPPVVPMLHDDHAQFILNGVVPKYVVEFLKHIQSKEKGDVHEDKKRSD